MNRVTNAHQQPMRLQTLNHGDPYIGDHTSVSETWESTAETDNHAQTPMVDRKSGNVTIEDHTMKKTHSEKFDNERLSPFKIMADALAIFSPLALLAFMIAIWRLNGKEVDHPTFSAWANSINVFATLFPILFASIIGRCVYEAARWKLERGSTLGVLEQLLGSRSVGSVVTTQLQLRVFNVLAISLLAVWAFSPLGSQSILRVLTSSLEPRVSTSTIVSYDNLHASGLATFVVSSPNGNEIADAFSQYLKVLFSATLMTPGSIKMDSMDQWGNVKIPFLPIEDVNSTKKGDQWQELPYGAKLEKHSSVAGLPVANIPFGNTTFSIESSYVELDCHNASKVPWMSSKWINDIDVEWNFTTPSANGTWQGVTATNINITSSESYPKWSIALNNFLDDYWVNMDRGESISGNDPGSFVKEDGIQVNPTDLFFWAQLSTGMHAPPDSVVAFCKVRQRYVESRVTCERTDITTASRNCTVTAQRPSQKPHASELISYLNFPHVWAWITRKLPQIGLEGASSRPDMVIQYLNDPKLTNISLVDSSAMFETIDLPTFSRRLSQVLNTYILLSQVHLSAPGGSMDGSPLANNVTAAVPTTTLVEVYTVSNLWISLGILSCCVLLVGGILSVVSRQMAAGPEILGYASAVIRDSKHVDLPPGTDRMNGLDITKLVKDQRVRYGFTRLSSGERAVAGVGFQSETASIGSRARRGGPLL